MLKKIKRRASRIRFVQKKILIVIEIDSCEWLKYEESFTPQPHSHATKDNQISLHLTSSQSSTSLPYGSSSLSFPQPAGAQPGEKHPYSPAPVFHALYNHALAPFYPIVVPLGSYFSLSVDKSGKCFMSTEQELFPEPQSVLVKRFGQKNDGITAVAQWHREIIECTGTLYYDPKTHLFQEKLLIIKLKMKKRDANNAIPLPTFGRDTQHLTLGKFVLPLHRIIHEQLVANNLSAPLPAGALSHSSKSFITTNYPSFRSNPTTTSIDPVSSRKNSRSPTTGDEAEAVGGEEEDEEDDNHSDDAVQGLRESSSSEDHPTLLGPCSELDHREETIPITSWNDIEKRIDIPLDEHANIILHGRVLVKFLPEDQYHPYHPNGIDNYFAKLMSIKTHDYEGGEGGEEEHEPDRKFRKEALASLQQEDSDHHDQDEDSDDYQNDGNDYPENRRYLDQEDRMSSISSLTSSNSPHSVKRKIFIKDLLISATAAANASIHHSANRFPATFPTAFFKKVKDRLQSPRSTSFTNLTQSTERGVLMRQESQASNDSNDSSLYGPTSYPQPNDQMKPQSSKLRKPFSGTHSSSKTPSPAPSASNSRKGSDASLTASEDINASNPPSVLQTPVLKPSELKFRIKQLWFEMNRLYLTNDGVFMLILTIILLIIVCEMIRRHFLIIPQQLDANPTCSSEHSPL